jgi:hypothetical protein
MSTTQHQRNMAEGNVVWIFRGAALASPFLAAILASFPWSTVVSFGLLAFGSVHKET